MLFFNLQHHQYQGSLPPHISEIFERSVDSWLSVAELHILFQWGHYLHARFPVVPHLPVDDYEGGLYCAFPQVSNFHAMPCDDYEWDLLSNGRTWCARSLGSTAEFDLNYILSRRRLEMENNMRATMHRRLYKSDDYPGYAYLHYRFIYRGLEESSSSNSGSSIPSTESSSDDDEETESSSDDDEETESSSDDDEEIGDEEAEADIESGEEADNERSSSMEFEGGESDEEMMTDIRSALRKRSSYIKANEKIITWRSLRRILEEDLKLGENSLDRFKKFIKTALDEELEGEGESDEENLNLKKEWYCLDEEGSELGNMSMGQLRRILKGGGADTSGKKGGGGCGAGYDIRSDIRSALRKRISYIKANEEIITPLSLRRLLEEDLKLGEKSLDRFKQFIKTSLHEELEGEGETESSEEGKGRAVAAKSKTGAGKGSTSAPKAKESDAESESEEEAPEARETATKGKSGGSGKAQGSQSKSGKKRRYFLDEEGYEDEEAFTEQQTKSDTSGKKGGGAGESQEDKTESKQKDLKISDREDDDSSEESSEEEENPQTAGKSKDQGDSGTSKAIFSKERRAAMRQAIVESLSSEEE